MTVAACARLCPHEAIALEETDEEAHYQICARKCSGCGICSDVCDRHAVSVLRWQPQGQRRVALTSLDCPGCGTPYHLPSDQSPQQGDECFICTRTTHYQDLELDWQFPESFPHRQPYANTAAVTTGNARGATLSTVELRESIASRASDFILTCINVSFSTCSVNYISAPVYRPQDFGMPTLLE